MAQRSIYGKRIGEAITTQELKEELVSAAHTYIDFGWHLLPVAYKSPLILEWPTRATSSIGIVSQWCETMPSMTGIGIATGLSGLIVVDIDGPAGESTVLRWRREGNDLPATMSQRTGRSQGGRHLIYTSPCPVKSRSFRDESVDLRATGGYIVAAPSLHRSGSRYSMTAVPVAPAPQWLLDMAGKAPTTDLPPKVLAALQASVGKRNESLFVVYRYATNSGMEPDDLFDLILEHPLGSKAKAFYDPVEWLRQDYDRFLTKKDDTWYPPDEVQERIKLAQPEASRCSSSELKILQALQQQARQKKSTRITIAGDQLAVNASVSFSTMKRVRSNLITKGLIQIVEQGGRTKANVYELLRIEPEESPDLSDQQVSTDTDTPIQQKGAASDPPNPQQEPVCVGGSHSALDLGQDGARFQVLGSTYRYFARILQGTCTTATLAEDLNASKRAAQDNTKRLLQQGIVVRDGDGYFSVITDWQIRLDELAIANGQKGRKVSEQNQVDAYRRERIAAQERWGDAKVKAEEARLRRDPSSIRRRSNFSIQLVCSRLGCTRVSSAQVHPDTGEIFAFQDADHWWRCLNGHDAANGLCKCLKSRLEGAA